MSKEEPYYYADVTSVAANGEYRGVRYALLISDMCSPDAEGYTAFNFQDLNHSDRIIEQAFDVAAEAIEEECEDRYFEAAMRIIDDLNDIPGLVDSFREEITRRTKERKKADKIFSEPVDGYNSDRIPF